MRRSYRIAKLVDEESMFPPHDEVPLERPKIRVMIGRERIFMGMTPILETGVVDLLGLSAYLEAGWTIIGRDPSDQAAWYVWRKMNPTAS